MGPTNRDTQSSGGKLSSGINPIVVMVGAVLLFGFIVLALSAIILQAFEDSAQPKKQPTVTAGAPTVTQLPTGASREPEPPNSGRRNPTPAPVQGYLIFGARTVTIRTAEAQLSRDGNRIAILLYSDEQTNGPTVSMVLELRPNSTLCDEASLLKSSMIIHLPFSPGGGRFSTRLTRTRSAKLGFPDIERFECIRADAGNLQLSLLGEDTETSRTTGWALRYGFALAIPLVQRR